MSSCHSRAATWKLTTPGMRVGQVGQLVVVRGEQRLRAARAGSVARCSATAQAMLRPSKVAVPRPISSRMTRLRDVAVCRMFAVSCISTMKVDWPRAMLSDAPTRAKIRSTSRASPRAPARTTRSAPCRQMSADLAQVGGLAAHVRAGQDDELVRACRRAAMSFGTNGSRAAPLDHRVAPVDDRELVAVVHVRLDVVVERGRLGQRGQHVERRERARRVLDARRLRGDAPRAAPRRSRPRARGSARRRRAPSPRTPSAPA